MVSCSPGPPWTGTPRGLKSVPRYLPLRLLGESPPFLIALLVLTDILGHQFHCDFRYFVSRALKSALRCLLWHEWTKFPRRHGLSISNPSNLVTLSDNIIILTQFINSANRYTTRWPPCCILQESRSRWELPFIHQIKQNKKSLHAQKAPVPVQYLSQCLYCKKERL